MLIIGVVGEKGAGKDTFSSVLLRLFEGAKVVKVRFSDILMDTLKMWGIEASRHNLQRMAIIMDAEFGRGTLTEATRRRIERVEADIVLLEGIRWKTDVPMLRSFGARLNVSERPGSIGLDAGPVTSPPPSDVLAEAARARRGSPARATRTDSNLLVYVTAEPRVRWERTKMRGEKVGEGEATYAQFEREEKAGTEVEIASIGEECDVKLVNNGTQEEFERKVDQLVHRHELLKLSK